ncbi:hypothetical protein L486_05726 [Kwoniella mangroviensis CBS 10435]|uniref:Major facilitator superfamily (MFS) profile domain-containing protein n=1 Tax=Kwoniella mangroviensis CBS 10435 TaxID=1331196 RepID=A0A1B9IN57_9TREE|nr:uncharacterized protein I203_07373 [Kwoniella mangroviensis CBS 8507]OCF56871.1 hypothetical protein L486_05726 [Kwoniella mangroviensis CBS 10435]OCF63675.1 hypothetical protein I203_07373 [Kwoniella mangroviensis CBS 8507]OCF75441.1 hypothetical protein I204_04296 [Kwoniella mangroviensis CBS 8886]
MAGTLLYLVTLLTALGFMLIGFDNGVMGGIINEAPFQTTFYHPSSSLLGTIVAIYDIGCCLGSIITAFVGEKLGRKRSIMIGAIVMLGGAGFQACVSSADAMIGARVVSGLGMVQVTRRSVMLLMSLAQAAVYLIRIQLLPPDPELPSSVDRCLRGRAVLTHYSHHYRPA